MRSLTLLLAATLGLAGCDHLLGFQRTDGPGSDRPSNDGPVSDSRRDLPEASQRADGPAARDALRVEHRLVDARLVDRTGDLGSTDPKAACGRPSVLIDTFDRTTLGPDWTVSQPSGTNLALKNNRLELTPDPNAPSRKDVRVVSFHAVNLDQDRIRVEVPAMLGTSSTAIAYLRAERDATHYLELRQSQGSLHAALADGGAPSSLGSKLYDPVAHRWWQIAHSASGLTFQISPNGQSWTTLWSAPSCSFRGTVFQVLGAATNGPTAAAGTVAFDNLNVGRPPAEWCKAASFSDDFSDNVVGMPWLTHLSGACTVAESGGDAAFNLQGSAACDCSYQSATAFDLTASSMTVTIDAISNFYKDMRVYLAAEDALGNRVGLAFVGATDTSATFSSSHGTSSSSTSYDPSHWYWRIAEQNGTLVWKTSADKTTWTTRDSAAVPSGFQVKAAHVLFGVSSAGPASKSDVGLSVSDYNP
jgi:hypothetical protein